MAPARQHVSGAGAKLRGLLILSRPLYNPGRPIREPGGRTHERVMNKATSEADASLELATELAELFRTATRRLQRKTRDTLRPFGLSGSQAKVVQLLADGPLRMSVIALRLAVVPRTATDVVDGCERAGVVVRQPDPEDRRSTLVELTPLGRQLLDQLADARRESAAKVFGPLTERQRTELLTLLREITEGDRR